MLKYLLLLILTAILVMATGNLSWAQENSEKSAAGEVDGAAGPTTFSRSWLTITYPENFIMENEFRGTTNMFRLTNPANRDFLSIIYLPLRNISYQKYYAARRGSGRGSLRSGDHHIFPGAKESLFTINYPTGATGYWLIIMPVGDKNALEITVAVSRTSEYESRKALDEWAAVIDSIKIEPEKTVVIEWDGIERFHWDGAAPAAFSYDFHPDFGFVAFHDSSAKPVLNFSRKHFDRNIAKSKSSATLFTSDALTLSSGFHFQENFPDPADPVWETVVEGLLTLKSGQLVFGAGTTPKEAVVTLPKGVYKFRAYIGSVEGEIDSQAVHFYFQPTKERENNKIMVLKGGRR